MKTLLTLLTSMLLVLPAASSELEKQFANPPSDCSPGIFWYWLNGFVTEAGIDADLQAMKQAGIGTVMIFDIEYVPINPNGVMDPVKAFNPEWYRLRKHAMKRAKELGLKVNLNNSMESWSSTAGPGITPELGMQKLTWSELKLEGGKTFAGPLPKPEVILKTYRDIAVLAFPTPQAEQTPDPVPVITSNVPGFDPTKLSTDPIPDTGFATFEDYERSRVDTALLKARVEGKNKWIWYPDGGSQARVVGNAPAGIRYFRRKFAIADHTKISRADLIITADNSRKVRINGKEVAQAGVNLWQAPSHCDIAAFLTSGNNVIAVEAENAAEGPAGLLANIDIKVSDGEAVSFGSDKSWLTSIERADGWQEVAFSDEGWKPALELGSDGLSPWGQVIKDYRYIQLTYDKPFAACSLRLYPAFRMPWLPASVLATGELQRSEDGQAWQPVLNLTLEAYNPLDVTFSAAPARYWRIALSGELDLPIDELKLSDDYRMNHWTKKAFFNFTSIYGTERIDRTESPIAESGIIKRGSMIDLSSRMSATGQLTWEVPPGNWTVVRYGYTPTGTKISSGDLECDKLDKKALDAHWQHSIRPWLDDPETEFDYVHIDSYEKGVQNWTGILPEEFAKKNRYALISWLPVLTGRVVDSALTSERVLWDFRRTVCDLTAGNYYGHMRELCNAAGKKFTCEPYGCGTFNSPAAGAKADVPMCELDTYFGMKAGASPAHLYDKPVVGAESFTDCGGPGNKWGTCFNDLKDWAHRFMSGGVNHFTYHVYAAQPFGDAVKPGFSLSGAGNHFNRGNTWWAEMPNFSSYLSRSSYLLRQGRFVGDVLFLSGEGSPKHMYHNYYQSEYEPPKGYDGDLCDLDVLFNRLTVKDGLLITPGGLSYRLLVVPNESDAMTPELTRRIGELVAAGARVMASKPLLSPSLQGQPEADAEISRMAQAIWGQCDGLQVKENVYGKGKILWGRTLAETLKYLAISPAIECSMLKGDQKGGTEFIGNRWVWIQRRLADGDLFFIANQADATTTGGFSFRTDGTTPQRLDPVTGKTRGLAEFTKADGRVMVPLQFAPQQAWFIFFPNEPVTESASKGNIAEYKNVLNLDGAWNVSFDPKWGGPEQVVFENLQDWSKHSDEGIRYYSGRATYTKKFLMPDVSPGQKYFLDLGKVRNLANIELNGEKLGTVWCAPWHLEITPKKGENLLEITVVNLWPNRLIGDQRTGGVPEGNVLAKWLREDTPRPKAPFTFAIGNPWKAESPLLESGLLGPVSVQVEELAE